MAIRFHCECGKKLGAPDYCAGRAGKCSYCGKKFIIPAPVPEPVEAAVVEEENAGGGTAVAVKKKSARKAGPTKTARDYSYLVLIAAMLPLIWLMFRQEDAGKRLEKTLRSAPVEVRKHVDRFKEQIGVEDGPLPDAVLPFLPTKVFERLPEGRIQGAMLARRSHAHWAFAAISAMTFWALIMTFFPRGTAQPKHLFYVGLFTGTIGIIFLLVVQLLADSTRGWIPIGGGVSSILFWMFKLIAGSYDAALDPAANFFVSAFGFMVGVGLLEESVKALPLMWHTNSVGTLSWRGMVLWGLASGIGFGVSEGITYAGDFYNGILSADIYVVRFVSCVALHAIWSASAAIFIYQQRDVVEAAVSPWEWISALFGVVIVSTFLHGMYDTMLKKDHQLGALLVAGMSFAVLAIQIEHLRKTAGKKKVAAAVGW